MGIPVCTTACKLGDYSKTLGGGRSGHGDLLLKQKIHFALVGGDQDTQQEQEECELKGSQSALDGGVDPAGPWRDFSDWRVWQESLRTWRCEIVRVCNREVYKEHKHNDVWRGHQHGAEASSKRISCIQKKASPEQLTKGEVMVDRRSEDLRVYTSIYEAPHDKEMR